MEDDKLINMFRSREELAIEFANRKYGDFCYGIAMEILHSKSDAAACVNDVWCLLWQEFPDQMPEGFAVYLKNLTEKTAEKIYLVRLRNQKPHSGGTEHKDSDIQEPFSFRAGWKYVPVAAVFTLFFAYCYLFLSAFLRIDDGFYQFQLSMRDMSFTNAVAAEDIQEDEPAAGRMNSVFDRQASLLPPRQDMYEGPVFAMTATGDNQDLRTVRKISCEIQDQYVENSVRIQPLMNVHDEYSIRNLSKEDKTVQLVYPFVTTLNRAYEMEEPILQVESPAKRQEFQNDKAKDAEKSDGLELENEVKYCAGKSIHAFFNRSVQQDASFEDYELLFQDESNAYMEQALRKDNMDNEEMDVYVFREFSGDLLRKKQSPVLGVSVAGTDCEVYTYGFAYEEQIDKNTVHYSLFVPGSEDGHFMLIVPKNVEIDIGYYTNLNWEEKVSGVSCHMLKHSVGKYHALKICANWFMQTLREEYRKGAYAGALPEYLTDEVLIDIAAGLGKDGGLYRAVRRRYHTSELTEAFGQILQETRVVFALKMVTIPAGQMVRIIANTQKRQMIGNFDVSGRDMTDDVPEYKYDFLIRSGNRINIKKASIQCRLPEEWKLKAAQEDWEEMWREGQTFWQRKLNENSYQVEISR